MEEDKIILTRNLILGLNIAIFYIIFQTTRTGLQQFQEDRLRHNKNPLTGNLNINSLRNKITDFRVIMKTLSLDYLILNETKIDESFLTAQFNVEGYEIRARHD